jgi:hypothetical protein
MICKQKGNYESFENPMHKTQSNCIPAYHKNSLKPNKKNKEKYHNIQFLMLLESKFFVKRKVESLCNHVPPGSLYISQLHCFHSVFGRKPIYIPQKIYEGVLAIKPKTHPFYKARQSLLQLHPSICLSRAQAMNSAALSIWID